MYSNRLPSAEITKIQLLMQNKLRSNEQLLWCGQEKISILKVSWPILLIPILFLGFDILRGGHPSLKGSLIYLGAFLLIALRLIQLKAKQVFAITNERIVSFSVGKDEPLWWIELEKMTSIERTVAGDIKFHFSESPSGVQATKKIRSFPTKDYTVKLGAANGAIAGEDIVPRLQQQLLL